MDPKEESARKALEEREQQEGAKFDSTEDAPTSLGKVELPETKAIRERDEEMKDRITISDNLHVSPGYFEIPKTELPSKGRFYHANVSIQVKAASGREIEHWTTMNETNDIDVDNHFKDIIKSCMKIKSGSRPLRFGHLLEADKLYVLLYIQKITFEEVENKITLDIECSECGSSNKRNLTTDILEGSSESDEMIEKYYDPETNKYSVTTKSYGTLDLYPPTVGTMDFIFKYVQDKVKNGKYYNKSLIQLLPYLVDDYSDLSEKDVLAADADFIGWDKKKIALVYRLIEKIKIGVKPTIKIKCSNCGSMEEAPVNFPDGPKALFLISDIEDELL